MCISELCLHPAACLLSWFVLLVAVQFQSWSALLVVAVGIGLAGAEVCRRWWRLVRRARWLLLSLGLILAYGTPGEALFDLDWAPTYEGGMEAILHMFRLVLLLGSLAWLFERATREDLLAGLWYGVRPLRRWGLDAERGVVRLALVMDILQEAPKPGNWRQLLEEPAIAGTDAAARVNIAAPVWRRADTMGVALLVAAMVGMHWLP